MGSICFFNTAKAWGGGEKWHLEVSSYLHSKGHQVLVIAHKESVLLQKLKGTNIPSIGIRVGNLSFLSPLKRNSVLKIFKKQDFSTIVMNLSSDVKIAGAMAKKAGIPRIIYRRGSAIPIKNTVFNRYLFQQVITEVLANSNATKSTVLYHNPKLFPIKAIKVIHNGITIADKIMESEPTPQELPILLNLGRLEYQKNQTFLIQLAATLKKRKHSFKMLIGGEGSLKNSLQQEIRAQGLENEVSLSGFIENPLKFISQASVFLLPSHWEGFGYVLAEAALCEKAIVAFDLSSNPELVIDGSTGFLVPKGNLDAYADKVEKLLQDKKLRETMGKNGRQHVVENFDENKQLQKIEAYLVYGS